MWPRLGKFWRSIVHGIAKRALSISGFNPHAGSSWWLPSSSGVEVNEFTALNCSVVWAAICRISQSMASLPCIVYQSQGRAKSVKADHPVADMLRWQPNPEMTSFSYIEASMGHCLGFGNAYTEIERTKGGDPLNLWPLLPHCVRPFRDRRTRELLYEIREIGPDGSTQTAVAPASDILHVPGLSADGIQGYNVIRVARESLGLTMAAEKFGATFFGNGAPTSGTINLPPGGTLSPDQVDEYRARWEKMHRGVANSNRIAILQDGATFTPVSMTNDDAQFLGTREFQIGEIARWFDVIPTLLHDLSNANRNIADLNQQFVMYSLRKWLIKWELEFRRKLFSVAEQKAGYYAEFNADDLLRGAMTDRFACYSKAINDGWMSVNDVRAQENLSPVDGGDVYRFPLNTTTLEHAAAAAEQAISKGAGHAVIPGPAKPLPGLAGGAVGSQDDSNHGEGKGGNAAEGDTGDTSNETS